MLSAWGAFVHRHRLLVLAGSGALLLASAAGLIRGGQFHDSRAGIIEATQAANLLDDLPHGGQLGDSFILVLTSPTLHAGDPALRGAVAAALARLRADPRVAEIDTPLDPPLAGTPAAATMVSKDRRSVLAQVHLAPSVDGAHAYPGLRAEVSSPTLAIDATGGVAVQSAFDSYLAKDLSRAETVSLPFSLLLLLLVFGALLAALLPVGVGVLSILFGVAGVMTLTHVTDVSQYALNIVTLVGLGVSIDYSLFIVSRFREELEAAPAGERTGPAGEQANAEVGEALARSLATAGRAVVFSGMTVAIGLSGMLFYPGTFLTSMGLAGAIAVSGAVFYSLTFLPAVLSLLGHRVNRLRLPAPAAAGRLRLWHRLAVAVMRRPVLVLLPTVGVILLALSPFFHIRLANGDITQLPPSAEVRIGSDRLVDAFPGQDQTRVEAVVDFPSDAGSARHAADLSDLSRRLSALPGVLRVVSQGTGSHVALLDVLTAAPPQSDAARNLVTAIRADRTVGDGRLLVTGFTAFDVDFIAYLVAHTPAALAYIIGVTMIVLFLLLGSVLLPLKAVVMNLLSLSASFGALVWIFQDGHLSHTLGFTPSSIDPSIPVLLFCIVFGLSMDYEVMLLSRMREEYRHGGDNRAAVAAGLERSGRLISGAAAIMIAVFAAFGLADVVLIKAIGLGMALAVAIDATLVRALIVPATMRLLGDLNWWAPAWLARLHARAGLGAAG